MSRPNLGRSRGRKPRRLNSFSLHIVETWESVIANGVAVLPFPDVTRARVFRHEAYNYRTALMEHDFAKFSLLQPYKMLLRENAKVEMEPHYDEKEFPWLLIIMSDKEAFGAATTAAGIEVE